MEFLNAKAHDKVYEFSDFLMMTLPSPRIQMYSKTNFYEIQKEVTGYANEIIEALGFFPLKMDLGVLEEMEFYGQALLFLGLIFDVIILLFTILSILLFYSLLMISIESKTFEFGIMRMVGLSRIGIVNVVILQSFMFVLPSLVASFVLTVPTLAIVYSQMFDEDVQK